MYALGPNGKSADSTVTQNNNTMPETKSTKERIKDSIGPTVMFCVIVGTLINMVRKDNAAYSEITSLRRELNDKIDREIRQNQENYSNLMKASDGRVETITEQTTIVEKQKPIIYENLVKLLRGVNDNNRSDTYTNFVSEWDSLKRIGAEITVPERTTSVH